MLTLLLIKLAKGLMVTYRRQEHPKDWDGLRRQAQAEGKTPMCALTA